MRLGIDLGGTAIKSGLVDDAGQVLFYETLPTNASGGADAVLDALTDACRRQLARAAVAAVGIGMPGTVDEARGVLVRAANLPLAEPVPEAPSSQPSPARGRGRKAASGPDLFGDGEGTA